MILRDAMLLSLSAVAACWILHVVVWRIRRPDGYLLWLPAIFFGIPYLCLFAALGSRSIAWRTHGILLWAAAILHGLICVCYIFQYTGIIEYSPSVEILKFVRSRMPEGVKISEIDAPTLSEEALTGKRVRHLLASTLLEEADGVLCLTGRGRALLKAYALYRTLLFLPRTGRG